MKCRFLTLGLALLLSAQFATAQTTKDVLNNTRIVKLSKAGMGDDIILSKIEASTCKFDLSDDGLIALKSGGVSGPVIQAMMDKAAGKKTVKPAEAVNTPLNTMPVLAYLNEINYYDKAGKSAKPLEKGKAKFATKSRFGKVETFFELPGEKSPFRISQQDSVVFLVNLESAMGDPTGWFSFYKTNVKKGNRIAVMLKTSAFSGKTSQGDDAISYNVKKLNDKTFQIIPASKMEKGEYMFFAKGTLSNYGGQAGDAFAFGID